MFLNLLYTVIILLTQSSSCFLKTDFRFLVKYDGLP